MLFTGLLCKHTKKYIKLFTPYINISLVMAVHFFRGNLGKNTGTFSGILHIDFQNLSAAFSLLFSQRQSAKKIKQCHNLKK